jgi:hypothetical protein
MKPMSMLFGETPGALAVLPDGAFDAVPVLFDELLHAATAITSTPTTAAARTDRNPIFPPNACLIANCFGALKRVACSTDRVNASVSRQADTVAGTSGMAGP